MDWQFDCVKCIGAADDEYKNSVEDSRKREWLCGIAQMLELELTGKDVEATLSADGYWSEKYTIPKQFNRVGIEYIKMRAAEMLGDFDRYNNYLAAFNAAKDSFCAYYVRTHGSNTKVGWKNVL